MSQTGDKPDRGSSYRTPRWVKVFGIITLIVVLVIVVVLVTGLGGPHGPRRHGLLQLPATSFQLPVRGSRFSVFRLRLAVSFSTPEAPPFVPEHQPTTSNCQLNSDQSPLITGHVAERPVALLVPMS